MTLMLAPADPALRAAVATALPGTAGTDWHPLPGGRTNRLWQLGDLVVKRYNPAGASPLFPNDAGAEARALRLLGPLALAPRLAAEGAGWVAYRHQPGAPWVTGPAPVAARLHDLHRVPPAGFRPLPSGSAAVLAQGAAILRACRGALPPPPPDSGVPPVAQSCLIHGDAVPGNILVGAQGVMLIDWQCPALGDPAEDLAMFLSPAMQFLYRGAVLSPTERAAFLEAYPDPVPVARYRALAPAFRWRMAAHCLWKAERGAADYAAALRLELAG